MKQLFLLIPWMFISLSVTGQSKGENPYAIFGGNPYVAGCQNENKFIIENISDKSEVSKIEHNPITGQVELINSIDHIVKEIQLRNNESGWHSMDPMAEKYYSISPYAYCANNPVKYIDPDGRDIWEINEEGRIINRIKDKSQDAFYMVAKDADGNYQRTYTTDDDGNINYNSISFEYGTIESQRSISYSHDGETYDVYQVRGDGNGTALFEFLGNNVTGSPSKVEIGQAMTGIEGDKGLNFITTGHKERSEPGGTHLLNGQLRNGYTVRELNHTHPNNPKSSDSDNRYKAEICRKYTKIGLKVPLFNISFVQEKTKIPY